MRKLTALWILLGCGVAFTSCNSRHTNRDMCRVVDERYVHKYGLPVPQNDWQSRGQNGSVISTLDNGVVVTKMYHSGILEGDTTYTFPHNNIIQKVETYNHGNIVKEVFNDESGSPLKEVVYTPDALTITTLWYEGGNPQCRETYCGKQLIEGEYYSPAGRLENRVDNGSGVRIERNVYGDLLCSDEFENGMIVSKTTYHPNGSPLSVLSFVNNVPHGQKRTFLPGGEPEAIEEWSNGRQHGITIYYKNGEKYAEVPFENGKRNGVEQRFRNGNEIVEEITWKDHMRHGPSDTYVNGKVSKTEWYYKGIKVQKSTYDLSTKKRTSKI